MWAGKKAALIIDIQDRFPLGVKVRLITGLMMIPLAESQDRSLQSLYNKAATLMFPLQTSHELESDALSAMVYYINEASYSKNDTCSLKQPTARTLTTKILDYLPTFAHRPRAMPLPTTRSMEAELQIVQIGLACEILGHNKEAGPSKTPQQQCVYCYTDWMYGVH
jgi:hypothetical protein